MTRIPTTVFTDEDRRWFAQQEAIDDAFDRHWDEDEVATTYGGQWIATDGAKILAHSEDEEALMADLRRRGIDAQTIRIRYIYPADAEFAF